MRYPMKTRKRAKYDKSICYPVIYKNHSHRKSESDGSIELCTKK